MKMALYLAKFAKILDVNKESYYLIIAKKIKKSIIKKFSNVKSLTGLACLTYFDILNKVDEVVNYLKKNDYAIHMGILGNKFVFSILTKYNKVDIGLNILLRKDYPSFRYWIDHNQTTLCEDFELTNSLNHHMFSCIAEFMIKGLMGVNINEDGSILLLPSNQNINMAVKVATKTGLYSFKISNDELSFIVPSNGKVIYKNNNYFYGTHKIEV